MSWIKDSAGTSAFNLDLVRSWTANTNGSVTLSFSDSSSADRTVAGIGTDEASAAEAMRRLTDVLDPAEY